MSCDVSNITFVVDLSICGHVDSMFSLRLRILLVPRPSQCYHIRLLSTSSPARSGHNKVRVINTTKKSLLKLGTCAGGVVSLSSGRKSSKRKGSMTSVAGKSTHARSA